MYFYDSIEDIVKKMKFLLIHYVLVNDLIEKKNIGNIN